jgi:hypothetical protein
MKRIGLLTAIAVVCGLAAPAFAQTTTTTGGGGTTAPTGPSTAAPGADIDLPVGAGTSFSEDKHEDPPPPPNEGEPPKIYNEDIPTKTDSLIFVIDVSGSMDSYDGGYTGLDGQPADGSRLDRAKVELSRAVQGLKEDFKFNILAYDCDTYPWMPARQQATPAVKASALGWVGRLQALGATGTGPAVCRALQEKDNFTVVLLSDGAPNCIGDNDGSIDDHRQMIRAGNTQGAVIHTFGIGCYGEFEQFLKDVASDSGGKFVKVS